MPANRLGIQQALRRPRHRSTRQAPDVCSTARPQHKYFCWCGDKTAFIIELIIGERSLESIAVDLEAYAFSLHDIIVPGTCIAISTVPLLGSVSKLLTGRHWPSQKCVGFQMTRGSIVRDIYRQ